MIEEQQRIPTRMKKTVFTLYHSRKGKVSGDRFVLRAATGLSADYIRALTNGARYSLHGWSLDPAVVPLKRGEKRKK